MLSRKKLIIQMDEGAEVTADEGGDIGVLDGDDHQKGATPRSGKKRLELELWTL